MKKLYIYTLSIIFFISCSKDDNTPKSKDLATPSLTWKANNIVDNYLEISITINSIDNLPSGKIEFKVDNVIQDTFTASKGTQTYTTSYSFTDMAEHNALLIYSFTDGRDALNNTIKIKKLLNETLIKSAKEDWMDL